MRSDFTNSACCLIDAGLCFFSSRNYCVEIFSRCCLLAVQATDALFIRFGTICFGIYTYQCSKGYLFPSFNITFIQTRNEIALFNRIARINFDFNDSSGHFRCNIDNGSRFHRSWPGKNIVNLFFYNNSRVVCGWI